MYKRRPGNFIDYMILKGLITGERFTVQPFHLGLAEKFEQVILGKLPDGKKKDFGEAPKEGNELNYIISIVDDNSELL